jgi:hypothetical protein
VGLPGSTQQGRSGGHDVNGNLTDIYFGRGHAFQAPDIACCSASNYGHGAILVETQPRQAIRDLPVVSNRRIRPALT